jgi:hypothetical protein
MTKTPATTKVPASRSAARARPSSVTAAAAALKPAAAPKAKKEKMAEPAAANGEKSVAALPPAPRAPSEPRKPSRSPARQAVKSETVGTRNIAADTVEPKPEPSELIEADAADVIAETVSEFEGVGNNELTEATLREKMRIGVFYIAAWLRNRGALPFDDQDAKDAETARSEIWHWLDEAAKLKDGRILNSKLFEDLLENEMAKWRRTDATSSDDDKLDAAIALFAHLSFARKYPDFPDPAAYALLD